MLLTFSAVQILGQLFSSLPLTMTELTISGLLGTMKHADIVFLFKAISLLWGLKNMHVPKWKKVVGKHSKECVEVLKGMPCQEAVHVLEVLESDIFPRGVTFKNITKDQEHTV